MSYNDVNIKSPFRSSTVTPVFQGVNVITVDEAVRRKPLSLHKQSKKLSPLPLKK